MEDSIYLEEDDTEIETSEWSDEDFAAEDAIAINTSDLGLSPEDDDFGTWAPEEYANDGEFVDPNIIKGEETSIAESALVGMDTYEVGFGDYTIDTGITADPQTMAKWIGAGESMMSSFRGLSQIAEEYTPIDHLFGFGKEDMQKNERYVRALSESEEYGTSVKVGQLAGYIAEPLGFLIPGGKAASVAKMAGRAAIVAGTLGYVDYVDEETGESRMFNTAAGVVLGGALGYGIGKLAKKSLPKSMVEIPPIAKDTGPINPNAIKHMEDMDTFEDLLAREMNVTSNPQQAMQNVQAKYPDQYAKGVDSKRVMSSTFDIEGAKANLPLVDEIARTGDSADMIDLDYLGKHRGHNGVEKLILTIDERVRNLSPKMYKKLMDYETYLKVQPQKLKTLRDGFASYFETHTRRTMADKAPTGTFSEAEVDKLKYFTINGKFDEADEFIREAKGDDAVAAFRQATSLFETKGQELKDAGIIGKLEDNYWARVVLPDQRDEYLDALQAYFEREGRGGKTKVNAELKDSLTKYKEHVETVKDKLNKSGKSLSEYEESLLFSRWFMGDKSHVTTNSGIKARGLKHVPEELARFYADPIQSMDSWIHRMTKEEANMNFLGGDAYKQGNAAIEGAGTFNNTAAVNHFGDSEATVELLGDMDKDARRELLDLMKLRMGDGLASPSVALKTYKGLVNSVLLGNPFSAFIQLGDIPRSAYNYGIKSAAKGLIKTLKAETGSKLTVDELGLLKMAQEFEDVGDDTIIGKIQDGLFKYSGFTTADRVGKETLLNSSMDHFAEAVTNPASKAFKKFRRKYEPTWGKEGFDSLVDDLTKYNANGRIKEDVSENIQSLLITELSQAQPINVSSQVGWSASNNYGKAFMTLKSFTLRQVNTVYRDIYKEASKAARLGDKEAAATATTNLVKFVGYVGGGNLAVSEARDIISGKKTFEDLIPTDAGDAMVYALTAPSLYGLKMFSIDTYAMDKLSRSGSIGGTLDIFAPPVPIVDDTWKMLGKKNLTSGDIAETAVKNTPYIGPIFKAIQRHTEGSGNVAAFAEGGLVQAYQDGGEVQHGSAAVDKMEASLRRELTPLEKLIVTEEGFSEAVYDDTKGVKTQGSGLTGEYIDKGFGVAVQEKADKTQDLITNLDSYPEELKNLMISSVYRGGLSGSPATMKLINEGDYTAAGAEFLNNDEYRDAKKAGSGVAKRMERLANSLASYGETNPEPPAKRGNSLVSNQLGDSLSAPDTTLVRDPMNQGNAVPTLAGEETTTPTSIDEAGPLTGEDLQTAMTLGENYNQGIKPDVVPAVYDVPPTEEEVGEIAEEESKFKVILDEYFSGLSKKEQTKVMVRLLGMEEEDEAKKEGKAKEEVLSFAKGGEVKSKKVEPEKLEAGLYEDDDGKYFKVDENGSVSPVELEGSNDD